MAQTTADERHHGHGHGHAHAAAAEHDAGHQQHPLRIYFIVWIWLFILSFFSYMVDFFHVQGMLRWTLILIFMVAKAGLIMAIFMHMKWERPALNYAIIIPVGALLAFVAIMAFESEYTEVVRIFFFGDEIPEGAILPMVHH